MLLLAHIDVVEARREDWTRDPFTLLEEDGYFYARGVADDKAMAAIWVDSLIRLHQEGFRPRRDIKMALTCGEETIDAFDGVQYLVANHPELIDAEFALNEGGAGLLDEQGRRVMLGVQAGEKTPQDFRLEVVNPGGHSSRPVKDNAIYHLSAGLTRLGQHDFPIQFNATTRTYFARMASIKGGEVGAAMAKLVANPADEKAAALVTANPIWNAMLRITCVATMLDAGHATNALPQRARQRELPHLPGCCRRRSTAYPRAGHGRSGDHRDCAEDTRAHRGAAGTDARHHAGRISSGNVEKCAALTSVEL